MKILIVEDEEKISNAIKTSLQAEKYVVDQAFDGVEGLDLILHESYDLILLDLMLPEITGEQICIKARKNNITTPIIMLTAKGQESDVVNGLDIGADDYIKKPFSINELKSRIKAVSRRPKKVNNLEIKLDKILINTSENKVYKNNKEVELSKREYIIFEYLASNKPSVISKEKLLDHVWGFDSEATENTVEVYINFLRKKLGKNVIKTKRGFGYYV